MFAVFLFLTYYLQQNLGYSPVATGVAFLPMTATVMVSAMLATTKLATGSVRARWRSPGCRSVVSGCST